MYVWIHEGKGGTNPNYTYSYKSAGKSTDKLDAP